MNKRHNSPLFHAIRPLAIITSMLISMTALAWSEEGILHGLSLKQNQIVVSDMAFKLAPNLKTLDLKGKPISALSLRTGTPVRIEIDDNNRVVRIQILRSARH